MIIFKIGNMSDTEIDSPRNMIDTDSQMLDFLNEYGLNEIYSQIAKEKLNLQVLLLAKKEEIRLCVAYRQSFVLCGCMCVCIICVSFLLCVLYLHWFGC